MLYGRGAGQMPTASAVMGDVIYACHHEGRHRLPTFRNIPDMDSGATIVRDFISKYCIRTRVTDEPGVMARIAGVFAKHKVSLKSVLQFAQPEQQDNGLTARITFLTHTANELSVQAAVDEMKLLSCLQEVESVIRVEE
jgi:homoserine dehydrogenase